MPDIHLRHMPGSLDVIDTQHPERLDWRQVFLSIDLVEGRWFHFSIAPKSDGRPLDELAPCFLFKRVVNTQARALADLAFPRRERDVLDFEGDMIHHNMPPAFKAEGISFSIHVNAVSQKFMRSLSNHQWFELGQAWETVRKKQAGIRSNPAR